jgi:CRP-like cAMP-binding protein
MYDLVLKNISRYIQLTPEETAYFISLLKEKKLRRKQYLLQEDDICYYEYFVTQGCLRTYYIDQKGQEYIVQFAVEDWWIGDMYSFLTQKPSRYNIDALEDSVVLSIEKKSLDELYIRVPKFEKFFRHLLQNAFIAFQERITSTISGSGEDRYKQFQSKYPNLEERIPQRMIASFLGLTPESLSRIRRQFADK